MRIATAVLREMERRHVPIETQRAEGPEGPRICETVCGSCDEASLWPCDVSLAVAEIRRLQGLLLGLADASGRVLGRDLAAIAQERGVTMAQAVAEVIAEVEAIRKERA